MNFSVWDMHGLVLQFYPTLVTIISGAWKIRQLLRKREVNNSHCFCMYPPTVSQLVIPATKLIRNRKYVTLSIIFCEAHIFPLLYQWELFKGVLSMHLKITTFFSCRHKLSRDLKLYQQLLLLPIIAIKISFHLFLLWKSGLGLWGMPS